MLPEQPARGHLWQGRACTAGLQSIAKDVSHTLLQASNVATYIAHGDVALSVLMTTASTLGAIFMTPLLTKLLAGTLVPVDAVVRPKCSRANAGSCNPIPYRAAGPPAGAHGFRGAPCSLAYTHGKSWSLRANL